MTFYFASGIKPSWLVPLGLWMLLPYPILFWCVRSARTWEAGLVALLASLFVVCLGFPAYFESNFVRFSTLDTTFVEIPFWQLIAALAAWLVTCRLSREAPPGRG